MERRARQSASQRAIAFAEQAYATQRKPGAGGFEHPRDVGRRIADAGYPEHVVAAAVLHDVVEDTNVTPADLLTSFGDCVSMLVSKLTEDLAIPSPPRRKAALRVHAAADGDEAAAIFAADKLSRIEHYLSRHEVPPTERLAHYRRSVEMLEEHHPEVPFLTDLRGALEALSGGGARPRAG